MVRQVFITDCEGPLTLNDNAYEIAAEYIEDGDKLFKIISRFDDYLADELKKPGYHAGDTLKLIVPFFKLAGLANRDLIKFSREHIYLVEGSKEMLSLANDLMDAYIVSTSYGQYIKALCDYMDFPFENTYHTELDLDGSPSSGVGVGFKSPRFIKELEKIEEFRKIILEHPEESKEDFDVLYDIFFNQIPQLQISKMIDDTKTVGGKGKEIAVRDIVEKLDLDFSSGDKIIYAGDSITDVEPLEYAKNHGGLAVSFNGNEYPLNVANIAVVSENAVATSIIIDLYSRFDRDYVFDFIRTYDERGPDDAFGDFEVDYTLIEEFEKAYHNKEAPIIAIINEENREHLLLKSKAMRNSIRGKDMWKIHSLNTLMECI